jgi:hypothetical protein
MSSTSETRTFTVAGSPTLIVRNPAGRLYITAGVDGQITAQITKKSHGSFLGLGSERDLDRVQVHSNQDADTLRVEVDYPDGAIRGVTVDLELTVPAHATLDLHLAAGELRIQGISGRMRATTAAGNLETHGVTFNDGSAVEVNAGKAFIEGSLEPGASLDITVNTGKCDVHLPASTATTLDASVDVGAIQLSGFAGQLAMTRELVRQRVSGPLASGATGTLHIRVNVGEITLRGE